MGRTVKIVSVVNMNRTERFLFILISTKLHY
jgi:hypothetical protein